MLGLGLGLGILQAKSFSPSDISNLVLWLDASDTSTITESGSYVSQWDDKSGYGYDAVQSTADVQPLTGTQTLNGSNVIEFDSDWMTLNTYELNGTSLFADADQEFTVFTLGAFSTNSGYFISKAGGAEDERVFGGFAIGGYIDFWVRGRRSTAVYDFSYDVPFISAQKWDGSSLIYYKPEGTPETLDVGSYDDNTQDINIGSRTDGAYTLDGLIAEILVFSRALTTEEINQVGNYLSDKWGITWNSSNVVPLTTSDGSTLKTADGFYLDIHYD